MDRPGAGPQPGREQVSAGVLRRGRIILGWLASLVILLSAQHAPPRLRVSPYRPDRAAAVRVSRRVFKRYWRRAVCIAYAESRFVLRARNGWNEGPWQVNVQAHPWVSGFRLTHSWLYAARVA